MSNQGRIDNFLRWCSDNSINIDDRLCVKVTPSTGVMVYSKCTLILPRASLVQIPKSAVLSVKSCSLNGSFKSPRYGLAAQLALSLALSIEILKEDKSKWFEYIQTFPCDVVEIPIFWTCAFNDPEAMHDGKEGIKWLRGTEVEKRFRDDRGRPILDQIDQYYREFATPYIEKHYPGLGCKSTLWEFYRAFSLVSSRAFLVDAYHGLAMVPVADAFNHVVENHVHLESDYHVCPECGSLFECQHDRDDELADLNRDGTNSFARVAEEKENNHDNTYEMVSKTAIPPNSEVLNTYGETLPNAQLLWQYGFTLDANENDKLTWTVDEIFRSLESDMIGRRIGHLLQVFEGLNNSSPAALINKIQSSSLTFVDTEEDDNILSLDADGRMSHRLWLLLFLIASDGMVDEDDLIRSAEAFFDFVGRMEDQNDGGSINTDAMNTSLLLEMGYLVSVICHCRRENIGKLEVKDEELGNLLDELPGNMPRTKAALSIALSEKSILNTCEATWVELMKAFDD